MPAYETERTIFPWCEFRVDYPSTCGEHAWFMRLAYIAAMVLSVLNMLCCTGLLYYKIVVKKSRLWMWDDVDGFKPRPSEVLLFFMFWFNVARLVHVVIMYTETPMSYISREATFELPWCLAYFGTALYLMGLVYSIPAPTRGDQSYDQNKRLIKWVTGGLCIFPMIGVNLWASLAGAEMMKGNIKRYLILHDIHYSNWHLSCVGLAAAYVWFGRKLIQTVNLTMKDCKQKAFQGMIPKLQSAKREILIASFCCGGAFGAAALQLFVFLVCRRWVFTYSAFLYYFTCIWNCIIPVPTLIAEIAMIYRIIYPTQVDENATLMTSYHTHTHTRAAGTRAANASSEKVVGSRQFTSPMPVYLDAKKR